MGGLVSGLFGGSQNGIGFQAAGAENSANLTDTGAGQQINNIAAQNTLAQQLGQEAQGGGPVNQATQAALTNATNQNNQMEAGSIASTKGINPAQAAYMAAQQAGQARQGASNQAAALTAQNAMGAQAAQSNLYGQIGQQANQLAATGQSGVNAANAANATVAGVNAKAQNDAGAGLIKGIAQGAMMAAQGGMVPHYANGTGSVAPMPQPGVSPLAPQGPRSTIGQRISQGMQSMTPTANQNSAAEQGGEAMGNSAVSGIKSLVGGIFGSGSSGGIPGLEGGAPLVDGAIAMKSGGRVPAMVSPGEIYLPPNKVSKVEKSKDKGKAALKEGEKIPGKAKVKGNSYANDTVHKTLEAGGLVLPRSVTEHPNAAHEAAKFVQAHLAKQGLKKKLR